MSFVTAAGFAPLRPSFHPPKMAGVPRVQPAPPMQQTAISYAADSLLSRISDHICENATELHCLDLERIHRRPYV
jgi:hypothetical protein